tara:strand:+ start:12684 stop:12857 length:174 start_codon:yes stop_codon:yes gene_type:complete
MVKPLVKVTNHVYPSLAAFYRKLIERGVKVVAYDGYQIETEDIIYKMVDGNLIKEEK